MKYILSFCLIVLGQSIFAYAENWDCAQPNSGKADKENFAHFCKLDSKHQLRVAQGFTVAKTFYVDGHYASCIDELSIIKKSVPQFQNSKELEGFCKNGIGLIKRAAALHHETAPFNDDFASVHDFWNIRAGDSLEKFKSSLLPSHLCKIRPDSNYSSEFVYYSCANAPYGAQGFSFFQGKLRKFDASVFKDIWNPTFRNSLAQFTKGANSRPYKYEPDGPVAECDKAKCKTYVFKTGSIETSLITTESGVPVKYSQVDNATMDASVRALARAKALGK